MTTDRKAKLAEVNHWDELLKLRDRQREQMRNGIQVIKEAELPLEVSRHGLMRWYLHPAIRDTILSTLMFYKQEIPPGSRSGRLKFQGGQVMYILEGRGHTVLDGVRHSWAAGDVVGPHRFTHVADYQARIAAPNALFPLRRKVDYRVVPWCTYTEPEVRHLLGMIGYEIDELWYGGHEEPVEIYVAARKPG